MLRASAEHEEAAIKGNAKTEQAAEKAQSEKRRLVFQAASRMRKHKRFYEVTDIVARGIQFHFERAVREHRLRLGRAKRMLAYSAMNKHIDDTVYTMYDENLQPKNKLDSDSEGEEPEGYTGTRSGTLGTSGLGFSVSHVSSAQLETAAAVRSLNSADQLKYDHTEF